MKIVVDANVLISAMVRDSATRKLILLLPVDFFTPEFVFEEVVKNMALICRKNSLSKDDNLKILKILSRYVHSVEFAYYADRTKEADKIIGRIDEKDSPSIALALAIDADGIWTDDKHFQKQGKVRIFTTEEIVQIFKSMKR